MSQPTKQEIADIRNQKKIDEAYDKSLTSPEMVSPPKKADSEKPRRRRPSSGIPLLDMLPTRESQTGMQEMRKGGYVRAADGICSKGKTRGKMV